MVWRAAVDGEARIFSGRGGFFCFLRGSLAAGSLAGPRLAAGFWDPLDWTCDHFFRLFASRFANIRAYAARAAMN